MYTSNLDKNCNTSEKLIFFFYLQTLSVLLMSAWLFSGYYRFIAEEEWHWTVVRNWSICWKPIQVCEEHANSTQSGFEPRTFWKIGDTLNHCIKAQLRKLNIIFRASIDFLDWELTPEHNKTDSLNYTT